MISRDRPVSVKVSWVFFGFEWNATPLDRESTLLPTTALEEFPKLLLNETRVKGSSLLIERDNEDTFSVSIAPF